MKKSCIGILYLFIVFDFCGCKAKDYILPTQENENVTNEKQSITSEVTKIPLQTTGQAEDNSNKVLTKTEFEGNTAYVEEDNALEVIITGKTNDRIHFDDSLNLITSIEQLYWFDDSHLAAIAHINPSLQCFLLYHLDSKKIENEKYGINFTWKDRDVTTLVYIVPKPHFSSDGGPEVIKNYSDEILYEAEEGSSLSNLQWFREHSIKFTITDENGKAVEKVIELE